MRNKKKEVRSVLSILMRTLFIMLLMISLAGCSRSSARVHRKGLFSRSGDVIEVTTLREELFDVMQELEIKELYQFFPPGTDTRKITQFINKAESRGISVWMLAGEPAWAVSADGEALSEQVVRAIIFGGMQGIMVDADPTQTEAWKEDPAAVMAQYVKMMKKGHRAASEANLEWVVCVPQGLSGYSEFKTLVKDCADAVALKDCIPDSGEEELAAEAALCDKYGRPLLCVYTLEEAERGGEVPAMSYESLGVEAVAFPFEKNN